MDKKELDKKELDKKSIYGKKSGVMTVYFSLAFLLILSLLFSLIETAHYHGIKSQIQCVTDMAVTSVFAEYQQELWKEYDVFYIDGAYGKKAYTPEQVKLHLEDYISYNLYPSKGSMVKSGINMFPATLEGCGLSKVVFATDSKGQSFYNQVVSMMENEIGIDVAKKMLSSLEKGNSVKEKESLISEEQTKSDMAMEDLKTAEEEEKKKLDVRGDSQNPAGSGGDSQNPAGSGGDSKGTSGSGENSKETGSAKKVQENPVETIKKLKKMGILSLVVKDSGKISSKKLKQPQEIVSKRTLQKGDGTVKKLSLPQTLQEILYDEYIMDKFSYWGKEKEDVLDYEAEYIIGGKSSDTENLKKVAQKILTMREAANFIYLLTDSVKREEAEALATAIGSAGGPALILALTAAILLAWSYAESILDTRYIFSGGKIPLVKTSKDWQLSLSGIPELLDHLDREPEKNETGFSYEDYLRFFLFSMNTSKRTYRTLDLIECNLQEVFHQDNVKMDHCIYAMEASFYWEAGQMFFSTLGDNPQNYIFHSSESYDYSGGH